MPTTKKIHPSIVAALEKNPGLLQGGCHILVTTGKNGQPAIVTLGGKDASTTKPATAANDAGGAPADATGRKARMVAHAKALNRR